jgi:hypothetical protein
MVVKGSVCGIQQGLGLQVPPGREFLVGKKHQQVAVQVPGRARPGPAGYGSRGEVPENWQ